MSKLMHRTCCSLVDGSWGSWTAWSSCSVTCGDGARTRSRECDNPAPQNGGQECVGLATDDVTCREETCTGQCPRPLSLLKIPLLLRHREDWEFINHQMWSFQYYHLDSSHFFLKKRLSRKKRVPLPSITRRAVVHTNIFCCACQTRCAWCSWKLVLFIKPPHTVMASLSPYFHHCFCCKIIQTSGCPGRSGAHARWPAEVVPGRGHASVSRKACALANQQKTILVQHRTVVGVSSWCKEAWRCCGCTQFMRVDMYRRRHAQTTYWLTL